MTKLLTNMQSIFDVMPTKQQMRHADRSRPSKAPNDTGDELAEVSMAVPKLPAQVVQRPEIIATLRSHLLDFASKSSSSSSKKTEIYKSISAHGQGGVGEYHDAELFMIYLTATAP